MLNKDNAGEKEDNARLIETVDMLLE